MARLTNVRMRSMLLLVQFLSTCSGIQFKEPDEYSCEKERVSQTGKSSTCMCDKELGNCTLSVTLEFGHVSIPGESTGLNGPLHMLGFNTPGEDGPRFEVGKTKYDKLGKYVNGTSPGPTLRVRAGDTLKIKLYNNLPPELVPTASVKEGMHDFDVVNLHTHGLHVSPLAPGDEIVKTKVTAGGPPHQYIYNIPDDHMGGTHWYHPHWHGAVTMHVNFGAAGMIIVEDAENQLPAELSYKDSTGKIIMEDYIVAAFHVDFADITKFTNSYVKNCICMDPAAGDDCGLDCDALNYGRKGKSPLPHACGSESDAGGEFNVLCVQEACNDPSVNTTMCAAQAAPFFVNPEDFPHNNDQLLLVNGQIEPTLEIKANTWVRLRLGFMATGHLLTPVIDTKCKYQLLAKDGVYMPSTPRTIIKGLLASGNRADVLINCPVGDFTFNSTDQKGDFAMRLAAASSPYDIIDGVLLHIHSVDGDAPPQCDLPVFEVNRPCYLVNLREQEVAKDLTFAMYGPPDIVNSTGGRNMFDPNKIGYTLPVGKVVGFDLEAVNFHPFHIHINPFQLTKNGMGKQWEQDWFQSGDWHDTLLNTEDGSQRVLMQTDFFTGPTVVHCHILEHEDEGMMVQVNFTGNEGTRYPPAYGVSAGSGEKCRFNASGGLALNPTCYTSKPLIDPTCYSSSKKLEHPKITIQSTCPPAPPPPLGVLAFKAKAATAEANTWKVTAIVLGVVLAAVLLLVAAVFVHLAMRGPANSGAAASGAAAGGQEMM